MPPCEAVAIFAGLDHYVTPSWYGTKRETGKVVPTWNYEAVHVHGRLRAIEDANWIRTLLPRSDRASRGGAGGTLGARGRARRFHRRAIEGDRRDRAVDSRGSRPSAS